MISGRVRALNLTVPLGSGRVRQSRVRASVLSPCRPLQGTTYTVEPLEGGPIKRLHRADLRPCVTSAPEPVSTENNSPKTQQEKKAESEQVEIQSDPDFVVLEEVTYPSLQETKQIGSSSAEGEVLEDQPELILEDTEPRDTEPEQFMPDTSAALRVEEPMLKKPLPTPRRTKRANAGEHSNPFNEPRSACDAVSLSPEVFSQVLTSLGSVFFREAVKEVKNMY